MPVTTICTPTQKVKKATILLMTMLPLVPIFRMMRSPCDRNSVILTLMASVSMKDGWAKGLLSYAIIALVIVLMWLFCGAG